MTNQSSCAICQLLHTGICINNQTCVCYDGYIGVSCQELTTIATPAISIVSVGAVMAGVLGGVLFTLIVGLIVFGIWKRRVYKKSLQFLSPPPSPSSEAVVVPALYDLSLSRQDSNQSSARTVIYHLYDELP